MASGYEKFRDYGGRDWSRRELVVFAIVVILIHLGLFFVLL